MKPVVSWRFVLLMASQNFVAYSESPLNAAILQPFAKAHFYW